MKTKLIMVILCVTTLFGCNRDADVASRNLSVAAEQFEIQRRIVFYNGITGEYMLTLEGKCSIEDQRTQLEVVCKTGDKQYKKHFLGLSDNVTYFAEQIDSIGVSVYHNRIIWKPQSIIPNIDINGSKQDFTENVLK